MKYTLEGTTHYQGKTYVAGREYDLDDQTAYALGLASKPQPKTEVQPEAKQMDEYQNKQMTSKKRK